MKPKLFLGMGAGSVGAAVMAILIYLLHFVGVNVPLITAISRIFVKEPLVGTTLGNTIGLIAHLMCGSIVGLGILMALDYTGYTRPVLKGALIGGGIWFLLCGIVAKMLNIKMQGDFLGTLFNLLIHIVYGVVAVSMINHFHNKTTARINNK